MRRAGSVTKRRDRLLADARNPDGELRGPNGRVLCRWCGTEVTPPRRTFCSGGGIRFHRGGATWEGAWGCVEEWRVRTSSSFLRRVVWARDRGRCAGCRRACGGLRGAWVADHRHALCLGGSGGLDNLQTLCRECESVKTRVDHRVARAASKPL
jgi:5-methylcytosine-specific restriction protein A